MLLFSQSHNYDWLHLNCHSLAKLIRQCWTLVKDTRNHVLSCFLICQKICNLYTQNTHNETSACMKRNISRNNVYYKTASHGGKTSQLSTVVLSHRTVFPACTFCAPSLGLVQVPIHDIYSTCFGDISPCKPVRIHVVICISWYSLLTYKASNYERQILH